MSEIIPGLKRQRFYTFEQNPGGPGVVCEDLTVAAVLLCNSFERANKVNGEEFPAATFAGTLHARNTGTGEKIFLFVITGDTVSLFRRQRLFHAGALRVDPLEYRKRRSYLMDALADAKQGEAVGRRMIPFREVIHEGKIHGQGAVRSSGNGDDAGRNAGGESGSMADSGGSSKGATGGDGR